MEQATSNQTVPKPAKSSLEYKKILLLLGIPVIIGIIAIVGLNLNQPVALSNNAAQISIGATGFVPQTLKVKKGQVVNWTNSDTVAHRLMADPDKLESFETTDSLNKGDSYTYIFDKEGTFHYYDPDLPGTLIGTVVVENE